MNTIIFISGLIYVALFMHPIFIIPYTILALTAIKRIS